MIGAGGRYHYILLSVEGVGNRNSIYHVTNMQLCFISTTVAARHEFSSRRECGVSLSNLSELMSYNYG